jgi:hypothetical protein
MEWTPFTVAGVPLEIYATNLASKMPPWDLPGNSKKQHWVISVWNPENEQQIEFDFFASIANPEIKSFADLMEAWTCFVRDAISGKDKFRDFCSEFGYKFGDTKAKRIHLECVAALYEFERLMAPDGDIHDYYSMLTSFEDDWDSLLGGEAITVEKKVGVPLWVASFVAE